MIFGLPTWLFVIFFALILAIMALMGVLIYMLFFRKVQVVVFGANGATSEIRRASKRRGRLWMGGKVNLPIYNNYLQQGKKKVYFAVKVDERTYVPYNLVQGPEEVYNIQEKSERLAEEGSAIDDKRVRRLNKRYNVIEKALYQEKERSQNIQDRIEQLNEKLKEGQDKLFGMVDIRQRIKVLKRQADKSQKTINAKQEKLDAIKALNQQELVKDRNESESKKFFGLLPRLDVNYDWLNVVADAYEEGTKRFEFGLARFAPYITLTVVVIMCSVLTIAAIKYNTSMSPAEADAYQEFGDDIRACAEYMTEASQDIKSQRGDDQEGNDNNQQGRSIPS